MVIRVAHHRIKDHLTVKPFRIVQLVIPVVSPEPEAPSPPPPDATLSELPVTDPVSETNPEPSLAEEVVNQN